MTEKLPETEAKRSKHLGTFVASVRQQLANPQRVVRAFDVGGSGIKTAKFSTASLSEFLQLDSDQIPMEAAKIGKIN